MKRERDHTKIGGINKTTATLASGQQVTYYYDRKTNTRLEGLPGTPEFIASVAAARAAPVANRTAAGTLSGLFRRFEKTDRWRKLADSTRSEYRRIMRFWEEKYGTAPFAALADKAFRIEVIDWHDEYSADHPREADNRLTVLARILSWAEKNQPLEKNVLAGFDRAYHGDRSEKIWLPEPVNAFLKAASKEMETAMMLALHTGQRQGDIRRMAWSNYDGTHIRLRQSKRKINGEEPPLVSIPCTAALRAHLDSLPRRSSLILTTKTGRAFQKRYFAAQWAETCAAAKIEIDGQDKTVADLDLHFHDLRGTAITMMFTAGCSVAEIVSITGHEQRRAQEILDKYLARTSTLADRAIAKYENVLETEFAKRTAKRKG